ncbi:MAG: dihydroorotate dehydrogenase [Candidatus Thermoplasmatota archaeon]
MSLLSTTVGPLRLENPTMLAAGVMGISAEQMIAALDGGAGAVVTKSIGLRANDGHPNPTLVETECGYINCMGLPNPGIMDFGEEVRKVARRGIAIGSVYARDARGFASLARRMEGFGTHAIELNLSCPNARGFGAEIGSRASRVEAITRRVKREVSVPVFPKLTPNVGDIASLAGAAEKGGADGVVAINTVRGMRVEPAVGMAVLSNRIGGYSGTGIKPIGVRCVYEIACRVDMPIIGVGGISNGMDALEYMMAGASAVQIGSAVALEGPGIFREICSEIRALLRVYGYRKLSEVVGLAVKQR